ncbi:unnamed protein product, partial [Mesorhabditis belari]|uniref:Uncharacterized protein n=1 Tax=Mesorhabditis belari TaxID=2138241 RepID=A0AAF3ELX6_9BILA
MKYDLLDYNKVKNEFLDGLAQQDFLDKPFVKVGEPLDIEQFLGFPAKVNKCSGSNHRSCQSSQLKLNETAILVELARQLTLVFVVL